MMRTDEFSILLDRLLPEALEPLLNRILGTVIPRLGDGDRFRVTAAGRFSGSLVGDLLAQAHNQDANGALVLVEEDVARVLYFARGNVVGADSNVVFERLGRVLCQEGILAPEDAVSIVEEEEKHGLAAAAAWLPTDAAVWGIARRAREISSGLYLMPHGHYVFVEGSPDLDGVPPVLLSPAKLAVEGLRRYDEWRNQSSAVSVEETVASMREIAG